ncbi:MAG: hypothetical protein HWN81_08125 [Candidatus Lokiarchaeota archaeon]|nr:hypothetical protein [Candidatus Lokiarchaeota archaeon]
MNIYQIGAIKANKTTIILLQLIIKRIILRLNLISASSDFLDGIKEKRRPKRGNIKSVEWIGFKRPNIASEKRIPKNIEANMFIIIQIVLK